MRFPTQILTCPSALGLAALACMHLGQGEQAAFAGERRLQRAALLSDVPLAPSLPTLNVLHRKLGAGFRMLDDPTLRRELEAQDRDQGPEEITGEALRDALSKMRRLALEDVQRTLDEVEPHLQGLPPTQRGRSLLCAVLMRKAHVALLREDGAAAQAALERSLTADPDFTLDQAHEPPPLVSLFERVRAAIRAAPMDRVRVVTHPPQATVVIGEVPLGHAPLLARVPRGIATTLWAIHDGFRPRNVTATTSGDEGQGTLSIEIRLDPATRVEQVRPLLDAFWASGAALRKSTAQPLMKALQVDALVLAQSGPGGRPRLLVYGAAPRWPLLSDVPRTLDLEVVPLHGQRGRLPSFAVGLIGGVIGAALSGGIILGTLYGTGSVR